MYNYVIFHKGCNDGFASFIILNKSKLISNDAIIYQDVPSAKSVPQRITGKDVIIMDVAYKYNILKSIFKEANSVTFIDHHITIRDDVKKLQDEIQDKNIKIIYDEKECGSSLTWNYLFKNKSMPLFLKYVKDNDIGTWKLKHTFPFITSLNTKYGTQLNKKNILNWNKLFIKENVVKFINRGKIYMEYVDNLLNENSKRYSLESFPSEKIYEKHSKYFKSPGCYKVAVVCGNGCPNASMLGKKMMETIDCDFVILWNLNLERKEYILMFRSSKVDVGEIASIFGGGGHKLASACFISLSKYDITELFYPKSLPRN